MFFTPNLVIGLTIMAAGGVLLLDTLGIRPAESLIKYWPGLIVLFGASLVAQAFRPIDPTAPKKPETGAPCFFLFLLAVAMFGYFGFPGGSAEARGGRQVSATAIMGNAERDGVGADVRSGRVAAVMGRSSLDLRQVELGPGEEVVVDVFVTMGRATVRIPDHWAVDASALPVMGSVDQERFSPLPDVPALDAPKPSDREAGDGLPPLPELPALPGDSPRRAEPPAPPAPPKSGPQPRLKLRGFVLMGKVEVSS